MKALQRNLAALGIGLLAQRLAQLLALLLVARTLGAEATGRSAQGLALGAMLAVAASAGLRNEVARGLARDHEAPGAWLRSAVGARLLRSAWLLLATCVAAFVWSNTPWFWIVSAAACLPAALDLKQLGDVVARTRGEVRIETASSWFYLAGTGVWIASGGRDVTVLALLYLLSRTCYAVFATRTILALPTGATAPTARELLRRSRSLAPAQVLGELTIGLDVCLVGLLGGDAVSGLYAIGSRIAGAAGMPTAQLTRIFFAHQVHAAARGDSVRASRVALRATALVLLPMLAGGVVLAPRLCGLFGVQFVAAADALRWLLLAVAAQHCAWQAHQALLAHGRDVAYGRVLWLPSLVHASALALLTPACGATGAAFATALSQLCFLGMALLLLGRATVLPLTWLRGPIALAGATGIATAALEALSNGNQGAISLALSLSAGGITFAAGIWHLEWRKRWHKIGAGLVEASRYRF
jgi:O-antigen/teichoic acid export membrane protein